MRLRTLPQAERLILLGITCAFVSWGAYFIYASSVVAVDGARYFSLFDDAMVSMRYAWNFSHGQGLVWNPGEYVEGYTNLLMVLVMSCFTALLTKEHAVLAVQVLGIPTTLCTAYFAMRAYEELTTSETGVVRMAGRISVFLLTVTYYPLLYWSLMGMETGLLTALVAAGAYRTVRFLRSYESRDLYAISLIMGLAYFTRPDSAIFAVIMLGLVAVHLAVKLSPLQSGSMLAVPALVYAAFPISQVAFRLSYYGELLPNTYTLKMQGIPLDVRLQSGLAFISPFLGQTALLATILLIGILLTRSYRQLLLVLPLPVAVVYQIYVGGEPWQLWRIMAPAMPLALCAFVLYAERALCRASDWLRPRSGIMSWGFVPIAVIGAAVAMTIDVNSAFAGQMTFKTRPFQFINNESNVNIAVALNNTLKEEATIGVIWAGTIPYYVDLYAVDYLGKCDKYVANLPPDIPDRPGNWASMRSVPGHNKQDFNYSIVEKRPTYTQTLVWGNNDVREWGARRYGSVRYLGVSLMLDKNADPVRRKLLDQS